jgi:Trk K+ transport system NAD-binding subunit
MPRQVRSNRIPSTSVTAPSAEAPILVCGLGSLGQACLLRLLAFDVPLRCLDLREPSWRDPRLQQRFADRLRRGDMRLPHVLRQAGVENARAVLLLGSESTQNFEAALQVRLLNPSAEVVVRSSSQLSSLGSLLEERLPGVAVVDPLLLTAGAVSEAVRPGEQLACFQVDGQFFVVREGTCEDPRLQRSLRCGPEGCRRPLLVTPLGLHRSTRGGSGEGNRFANLLTDGRQRLLAALRWLRRRPVLQWVAGGFLMALLLGGIGLFSSGGGWSRGALVTLALLKGEYVDPVNVLLEERGGVAAADPWLIGGSLVYALVGTLLTSTLVAVILEWLLRERFGLVRRARVRRGSHILLVEGGELGLQVALSLQGRRHGVVWVDSRPDDPGLPGVAMFERLEPALAALRSGRLEGIGLLSPDLLANLRTGLGLQHHWPRARTVILAHAVEAAEQLGGLLGGVSVISSMDLAADAVVATAFGERVEEVCRIDGANLLLVRYRIRKGDTLFARSIARVENGYGVTAVLLRRARHSRPDVLPSPDLLLGEGDELLVLGTLVDLRGIELGRATPPAWCLCLQGTPEASLRFDALQSLARHLGGAPGALAPLLDGREHRTGGIDRVIGEMLLRELPRLGIRCHLEPVEPPRE